MQASTPATKLISKVTSVPRASSGIAISTMPQSIVTLLTLGLGHEESVSRTIRGLTRGNIRDPGRHDDQYGVLLLTTAIRIALSPKGCSRLLAETRNRVGHVHSETKPFLLQLI